MRVISCKNTVCVCVCVCVELNCTNVWVVCTGSKAYVKISMLSSMEQNFQPLWRRDVRESVCVISYVVEYWNAWRGIPSQIHVVQRGVWEERCSTVGLTGKQNVCWSGKNHNVMMLNIINNYYGICAVVVIMRMLIKLLVNNNY